MRALPAHGVFRTTSNRLWVNALAVPVAMRIFILGGETVPGNTCGFIDPGDIARAIEKGSGYLIG
jgi:hypothetical protein